MNRLIRKALWGWEAWRMRRAREKAIPVLREFRLRKTECRKSHRRGAASIEMAQRDALHRAMRGA